MFIYTWVTEPHIYQTIDITEVVESMPHNLPSRVKTGNEKTNLDVKDRKSLID